MVEFQLNYVLARTEPRKVMAALNSLPNDLHEAYNEVFKRIQMQGPDRKDLVLKIVSWILYAKRPLKMDELREAIAIEPGDTKLDPNYLLEPGFIVEISESLVSYNENSGSVGFSHFTVYEFLASLEAPSLLSAVDFAKVCLTCLDFQEFEARCESPESMEEMLQKHPFCRYIGEYWGPHLREADEDADVQKLVLSVFVSDNKRYWALTMKRYVMCGAEDMWDYKGQTLFHVIAKNGLAMTCRYALELSLNGYILSQKSKLMEYSTESMIPGLQNSDLDLAGQDEHGKTALQYAVRRDHVEMVKILANAGGTSNNTPDEQGWTVLHHAIWNRSLRAVQAILATNIDLNAQDKSGRTAMFLAAVIRPNPEILKLLLDKGANPDSCMPRGRLLYEIVCVGGNPRSLACFKLLLAAGVNVNAQVGSFRWTPLHEAAAHRCEEFLKPLLDVKADISIRDHDGLTAMELAILIDYTTGVKLILETNPDLNMRDAEERTALHHAVLYGSIESMKLLLDANADVNARDKDGWTPLHYAAGKELHRVEWQRRKELVDMLLKANAEVNAETKEGMNPLRLALKREDVDQESVNLLLDATGGSAANSP